MAEGGEKNGKASESLFTVFTQFFCARQFSFSFPVSFISCFVCLREPTAIVLGDNPAKRGGFFSSQVTKRGESDQSRCRKVIRNGN